MNRDTHNTGGPDQHALVSEAWRQVQHAPHALAGAGGGRELGPDGLRLSAPEIPGYTEWSPLHRGGQGAVYRAVQASTRRTVAIKVMLHGAFAGEGERLRFAQEVKILGELRHPAACSLSQRRRGITSSTATPTSRSTTFRGGDTSPASASAPTEPWRSLPAPAASRFCLI